MKHVALLRGINVGGKCKLPMRELAALFTAAGANSVATYIQSGNVIFEAASPNTCVAAVTAEIARVYGYSGRIVLRSAQELREAFKHNPFTTADPDTLHVYFLASRPEQPAIEALDPNRSPGDAFHVRGREIYLHLPQGMARTKLTNAWFDTRLKTTSTARNWRTVARLVELAS